MKRYSFETFALTMCLLLYLSCESDPVITAEAYVDEALTAYFERFEEAAIARGHDAGLLDGITATVENITTNGVAGQCHSSENSHRVVIDRRWWQTASDTEREFLVFHELGHCALGRSHDNATDGSGYCLSIMHSSTEACRFIYNASTQQAYWNELFE